MAFKNRENQNSNEKVNSTPTKQQTIDVNSIKSYDKETQTKLHFLEEAKEVINILEEKGIDIYSEDNYPGMYLKGNKKQQSPKNINKFLSFIKNKNN